MAFSASEVADSSITRAVLVCLQNSSSSIPVPGFAAAIALAVTILDISKTIRTQREQCSSLAKRAAELVLSIHMELLETDPRSRTPATLVDNIEPFLNVLRDIQQFTDSVNQDHWLKQMLRNDAVQKKLKEYTGRLDDCFRAFQIKSLFRVHRVLSQLHGQTITLESLRQEMATLRSSAEEAATDRHSEVIHSIHTSYDQLVFQLESVRSQVDALTLSRSVIDRGELHAERVFLSRSNTHGTILHATFRKKPVLVKRFEGNPKLFLDELALWKDLWNPHLPQLVGHSSQLDSHPFLVLDGVISRDVQAFVGASLSKTKEESFMTALSVLYGISSAIEYLRSECRIAKEELKQCLQISNVLLSSNHQAVIGENIIISPPSTVPPQQDRIDLEVFLADEFWYLTRDVLYQHYDHSNWENVGSAHDRSHLRSLLDFACFGPSGTSMSSIARKLSYTWTYLHDIQPIHSRQIQFPDIRQCLLSVKDHFQYAEYSPQVPWDVSPGDLGYVRSGHFMTLTSVTELQVLATMEEGTITRCVPKVHWTTEHYNKEWIRHEFHTPVYISVRRFSRESLDAAIAIRHLLKHGLAYLDKYKEEHSLSLHDLILITTKETSRRSGTFEFVPSENQDSQPPKSVFLFERQNLDLQRSWAFWSLMADLQPSDIMDGSDTEIKRDTMSCSESNMISSTRIFPQMIEFVQLENEDLSGGHIVEEAD